MKNTSTAESLKTCSHSVGITICQFESCIFGGLIESGNGATCLLFDNFSLLRNIRYL